MKLNFKSFVLGCMATAIVAAGIASYRNSPSNTGTAQTATEGHFVYTVGNETHCFVGGQEVSIRAFQKAVCTTPDGIMGQDPCTSTHFMNNQRSIGL